MLNEILKNGTNRRDAKWTERIAVGDKEFVMETKAKLGAKAISRREMENNEGYELKEPQRPYNRVLDPEKCCLRLRNNPRFIVQESGPIFMRDYYPAI